MVYCNAIWCDNLIQDLPRVFMLCIMAINIFWIEFEVTIFVRRTPVLPIGIREHLCKPKYIQNCVKDHDSDIPCVYNNCWLTYLFCSTQTTKSNSAPNCNGAWSNNWLSHEQHINGIIKQHVMNHRREIVGYKPISVQNFHFSYVDIYIYIYIYGLIITVIYLPINYIGHQHHIYIHAYICVI